MLTGSPIAVYSSRLEEPTLPDMNGPLETPIAHLEVGGVAELGSRPVVESRQPLEEHLSRDGEGAVGVIVGGDRGAEDGEDPIAQEAEQRSAVVEDRVAHLAEVVVQDVDDDVRLRLLGEGRESAQVAEENGADETDTAAGAARRSCRA